MSITTEEEVTDSIPRYIDDPALNTELANDLSRIWHRNDLYGYNDKTLWNGYSNGKPSYSYAFSRAAKLREVTVLVKREEAAGLVKNTFYDFLWLKVGKTIYRINLGYREWIATEEEDKCEYRRSGLGINEALNIILASSRRGFIPQELIHEDLEPYLARSKR
jgi:hypothetical protein